MDKPIDNQPAQKTTLWENHPHAKIWLAVTGVVVLSTIVAVMYYLNNQNRQNVSQDNAFTPAKTAESSSDTGAESETTPATSKGTAKTSSNPSTQKSTTTTSAKTLAQELKSIDLSGLSESVDSTQRVFSQFSN